MMSIRILIIHNSFADHDMFMRYRGGGVGHLYMRAIKAWLLSRWWYILHYHRSTLLLPFRGEVLLDGGGVEERCEVMYCIEE